MFGKFCSGVLGEILSGGWRSIRKGRSHWPLHLRCNAFWSRRAKYSQLFCRKEAKATLRHVEGLVGIINNGEAASLAPCALIATLT